MESTIWPTWSTEFDPTKDRYVRSFSSTPLISSSTISSMSIRVSSSSAMELSTAALESWPRSSRRSLSRCYWDRHRPLELAEGLDAKLSAGRSRRSGRCGWDGPHGVFQRASLVESAGKIARLLRLKDADGYLNSMIRSARRISPGWRSQRYARPPRVGYLSTLSSRLHIAS